MSTHALLSEEYHRRLRDQVAAGMRRRSLHAVIAPAVEDIALEDVRVGDVLQVCDENVTVVEMSLADGWLVFMDSTDRCAVIRDCHGVEFTKVEVGFV